MQCKWSPALQVVRQGCAVIMRWVLGAHIVPDFASQNSGGAVEGHKGNPDADPASNLVAQRVLDTSSLQAIPSTRHPHSC